MTPDASYLDAVFKKWFVLIVLTFILNPGSGAKYTPPTPKVEPLFPKGLRMSIPHEDGITLVAFHINFNEEFEGIEAGTIARDIIKIRNGRWKYEDHTTRLKRGDIVYYWMHVVYDGLGYNLVDKQYTVNEFYDDNGNVVDSPTSGTGQTCTVYSDTYLMLPNGQRQNTCPGQLIFEENFNDLNTSRWAVLERFSKAPNYEFVVYMDSTDNVEVKDGNLHITPILMEDKLGAGYARRGSLILSKCTDPPDSSECRRDAIGSYILPPIISGRLNTKKSFHFLYGRVQVRAKLPRGDWLYPLITLENIEQTPQSSIYHEIRIAYANGNPMLRSFEGSDIGGSVLQGGGLTIVQNQSQIQDSNRRLLPMKISNKQWSDDYHIYEVEWKPGRVIVKVDGEEYGNQNVPLTFDIPVYLNLALGVGGHGEFQDRCMSGNYDKPWRNIESKALFKFYLAKDQWLQSWRESDTALHVDYVKVWAL